MPVARIGEFPLIVPRCRRALGRLAIAAALAALVLPTGCVRRRLAVRSNPPGALVFVDNQQIGTTPCSVDFTYYGTREIRLVKDGYETLTVNQPIPMPWYQIPPLDFVSETLVPNKIEDHRTAAFNLQPQVIVPTEQLVDRANQLRQETLSSAAAPPPTAIVMPAAGAPLPATTTLPATTPPPSLAPTPFAAPPMEAAPTLAPPIAPPPTVPYGAAPAATVPYGAAPSAAAPYSAAPYSATPLPTYSSPTPAALTPTPLPTTGAAPTPLPPTYQSSPPATFAPTPAVGSPTSAPSQQIGPPIVSPPLR